MMLETENFALKKENNKTYVALARKYRPQKFSDLIGQEISVKILGNSIKKDQLPQAIILTGIRGIGKTTIARLIAKSINCKNKIADDINGCGECNECLSISTSSSSDVLEMDAASNTGVNDIRDIIESARYKPINSKYRVFIIDEVHMLSISAFNALLKTLEEPPSHVKFILATTESHKIPLTIVSRCQKFNLKRFSDQDLKQYYLDVLKKEGVSSEDEAIDLIAKAADGSVRDGLSIMEQAIYTSSDNKISLARVREMLGYGSDEDTINIMHSICSGDVKSALKNLNEAYWNGSEIGKIITSLSSIVHRLARCSILKEIDSHPSINEMAMRISGPFILRMWEILMKSTARGNFVDELPFMEMLIMKLASIDEYGSAEEIVEAILKEGHEITEGLSMNDIADKARVQEGFRDTKAEEGREARPNDVLKRTSENDITRTEEAYSRESHPGKARDSENKASAERGSALPSRAASLEEEVGKLFDMIAEFGDIELYSVLRNEVEIVHIDFAQKKLKLIPSSNYAAGIAKRVSELGEIKWNVVFDSVDKSAVKRSSLNRAKEVADVKMREAAEHPLVRDIEKEIGGVSVDGISLQDKRY